MVSKPQEPTSTLLPARRLILVNVLLFQLGWFACVISASHQRPAVGAAVVAVVLACHLRVAARPRAEAGLIALVGLIGMLWESALVILAGFHYTSGSWAVCPAPYWLIAMWLCFATTINVSLRWLRPHPWLAAALGALGGPLAFYSGAELGAVSFDDPQMAMLTLVVGWAILVPVILAISSYFDGFAAEQQL